MGRPRARLPPSKQAFLPSPPFPFPSEVRPSPRAEEDEVGFEGCWESPEILPFTQALPCLDPLHNPSFMPCWLRPFLKNDVQKKPWAGFQFRLPCLGVRSSLWNSVFPSVKWRPGGALLQLFSIPAAEITRARKHCVLGPVLCFKCKDWFSALDAPGMS